MTVMPSESGDGCRPLTVDCRLFLGAPDEDAGGKDEHSPDHYLKCRRKKRGVHISMPDVTDDAELNRHNADGDSGGRPKAGYEKG